jgi:hypothetical protein
MHPVTARRLVERFVPPGGTVLDPFAGSGTVLVEGMLAGASVVGSDLNPLAVELCQLKTTPRTPDEIQKLRHFARAVAAVADERRKGKEGPSRPYPAEDLALFDRHVLLELDGLRVGIEGAPSSGLRRALALVLSSILVKLSRKSGDTAESITPRRIAAGYPAKLFVKKTDELALRLDTFRANLPMPTASSKVFLEDARVLRQLPSRAVDGIVSSPPYVATYDYLEHHKMRLRWLGLSDSSFEQGEFGSRRAYSQMPPQDAFDHWCQELTVLLHSLGRVARPNAPLILLMADSAVGRDALRAEDIVLQVSQDSPFRAVARASQPRPHFHVGTARAFAERPRREHALLLVRR